MNDIIEWFRNLKPIVDVLGIALAATSIFLVYLNYRRSIQIKKAEWLTALSAKFYETPTYKRIRRTLDWEHVNVADIELLKSATAKIRSGATAIDKAEYEIIEDLVDYLNFFELIGSLVELKQVNLQTVDKMFNYYISNLKSHQWLLDYLKYDGFERTAMLIDKISGR